MGRGFIYSDWNRSTDTTAEPAYFRETAIDKSVDINRTVDINKPVRFIDYDGNIVASYTPEEFAELTSLPTNPTHEGLTAQGWNWTLSDAKEHVSNYGALDIGQMYVTDDGRTRLYVRIQDGRRSPVLQLYLNANTELDIDWGDDTSHSTFTSTSADFKSESHTYASAGDYIISIGVTRGSFSLQSASTLDSILLTNRSIIRKIGIGNNITSIGTSAFSGCYSLSQVTIPNNVTNIRNSAFSGCYSLSQITIPNNVTSIRNSTFNSCHSLSQITIPNNVTSIESSAFNSCHSLSQITIPNNVTSIEDSVFTGCYSLSQVIIPNNVTSIGNSVFNFCYSLSQVIIPNNVTSIGNSAFTGCHSLSQVIIPNNVTSIGNSVFNGCKSLGYIKFTQNSPPTVSNSNAFLNLPIDCKILVPRGSLSVYTSATNYPSSSTYTYEEYDA